MRTILVPFSDPALNNKAATPCPHGLSGAWKLRVKAIPMPRSDGVAIDDQCEHATPLPRLFASAYAAP